MLLAIDIGNTNMEFGIFDGERLAGSFRLGTNRDITSDEVGLFTSQFFRENDFDRREIEDVVITSVVPQVMYSISNAVKKYFYGKVPLVAGDNLPFQIENRYEQPKEVGADRLVAAVGALAGTIATGARDVRFLRVCLEDHLPILILSSKPSHHGPGPYSCAIDSLPA